jgi:hypothetical protein
VARGVEPGDDGTDAAWLPGGRLQAYGGEIGAVGRDETAFDHRDALVEFVAGASWSDAADDQARMARARRYAAAMAPFSSGVSSTTSGTRARRASAGRTGGRR